MITSQFSKTFPVYPDNLTLWERYVWFFKDQYYMWFSFVAKKKYCIKIKLRGSSSDHDNFCHKNFHTCSYKFGSIDYIRITEDDFHNIELYMTIKFIFEKDAAWFALYHGNDIV